MNLESFLKKNYRAVIRLNGEGIKLLKHISRKRKLLLQFSVYGEENLEEKSWKSSKW